MRDDTIEIERGFLRRLREAKALDHARWLEDKAALWTTRKPRRARFLQIAALLRRLASSDARQGEGDERGIFDAIRAERERQDAKWGTSFPDRDWDRWLTILVEEVGEVAEAVLEMPYEGSEEAIREELVQVAAVAVSALEFGAPQGSQRGAGGAGEEQGDGEVGDGA